MAASWNLEARSARRRADRGFDCSPRRALLRLLVRIDRVAGLVLRRRQHGLIRHAAPDIEAGARLDAMILHLQHAGFLPFALGAELDVTIDGLVGRRAYVVGKLAVIEALGRIDRLAIDRNVGVTPRSEVIAERINAGR